MQKNLNTAEKSVSTALQRIATGYKINSAKDDAAGMYISEGLKTQINGLKQAQKNTQDGLSFINTGLGAFSEMTKILNRLRDLSLQASNGVYDESSKNAMQAEADELNKQLEQIINSTNFNGKSLFRNTSKTYTTASTAGTSGLKNASYKVNNVSSIQQSLKTAEASDSGLSGTISFTANETKTVYIDSAAYKIKNKNAESNDFGYAKDKSTGEVTFSSSNFEITADVNTKHNVILKGGGITFRGGNQGDKIQNLSSVKQDNYIYAGTGDDIIINESVQWANISSTAGNDIVTANTNCNIVGGTGNSVYNINAGYTIVNGGSGNETFNINKGSLSIQSRISAYGRGGNDIFNVSSVCKNVFIDGGDGTNTIYDNGTDTDKANVLKADGTNDSNTYGVDFIGKEIKEITIDSKKYKLTNQLAAQNTFYYKILDGVIHFIASNFIVEGQKDVSHQVALDQGYITFIGGDLDDKIEVNKAYNTVYGGKGDDEILLTGEINSQKIYGQEGNDKITITGTFYKSNIIDGGDGDDTFNLYSKNSGGIYGGGGNDTFNIYNNNNVIDCGEGDDVVNYKTSSASGNVIIGGGGTNTINGTAGANYTSDFADSLGTSVVFNSKDEVKNISINGINYTVKNNLDGKNSLFYFYNPVTDEILFGGSYLDITGQKNKEHNIQFNCSYSTLTTGDLDDKITNNHEGNYIYAGAGADTVVNNSYLYAYIYGQDGNDTLIANSGRVKMYGGDGDDEFFMSTSSFSSYEGQAGNDIYHFLTNSVNVVDTEGDNTYHVDTDNNSVIGGNGKDTFYVNGNNNLINGQGGDDYLVVDGGGNYIDGGSGTNLITGSSTTSTIINGTTDPNSGELIFSSVNEEKTIVLGGKTYTFKNQNKAGTAPPSNSIKYSYNPTTGEVSLIGSDYTLTSQDGKEHNIRIQGSNNTINGGSLNDKITIQSGTNNYIHANAGNDTILSDTAGNHIFGGDGDDSIILNAGASNTEVSGGAGNDTVTVSSSNNNIDTGSGNDRVSVNGSNNTVNVNDGKNNVIANGSNNNITALDGDNRLSAVGNLNSITTGSGDNIIGIQGNQNTVVTGDGSNNLTAYGDSNNITTGSGKDKVIITGSKNNIATGAGEDNITISGDENIAKGGEGNDEFLIKRGNKNDIDGNEGTNNTMIDYGVDTIFKNVSDITPDPSVTRIQVGADGNMSSCINVTIDFAFSGLDLDFSTTEKALGNIENIDDLLETINRQSASLAAVYNRLESALESQSVKILNMTASRSTIMDADIAQESANFIKNRILMQTSASLMSQMSRPHQQIISALVGS